MLTGTVHAATEWHVSLWGQRRAFTEHLEKLAELVAEKTNGDFTLNLSYGGLAKNTENLDGISNGDFEMAQICAGYHPEKNPLLTVLELPFLGVENLAQEVEVSMALYHHPAVVREMEQWNAIILMPSPLPQYNVIGQGRAPASLDDFSGIRVRATGGIGNALAMLGAQPTPMPATEVRQAMNSGAIEGASFAPHAHMSFSTLDASNWWTTNLNPGTVNCPVIVNTDALRRLSSNHRRALASSVPKALAHYITYYNQETMEDWLPTLEERDIELVTFSDDELGRLRVLVAQPAAEAWIRQQTERGLPGRELYEFVISTLNH
ncbi:C4-dicarboxylate TRAP transporter substrate-binding protein [Saccharospirillum salsuginis]|nr:C4-dicarboxylate TRAP transporter substrate-binding protein [Saccharospirillum salsuginis]